MEISNYDLLIKYLFYLIGITPVVFLGLMTLNHYRAGINGTKAQVITIILLISFTLSVLLSAIFLSVYVSGLHGPNQLAIDYDNKQLIDTGSKKYDIKSGVDYHWVDVDKRDFYPDYYNVNTFLTFNIKIIDGSRIRNLKFDLDGINFTGSNYQRYLFHSEIDKDQLSNTNRFNWINKIVYDVLNHYSVDLIKFNNPYDNDQQLQFDLFIRNNLMQHLQKYGIELTKPIKFKIIN